MNKPGPNLTMALIRARASREGNPRAAKVAALPQSELAAFIRARLPNADPLARHLADCIASCDATPDQAAQARHDLGLALERMDADPAFVASLLKDSDGR